MADLDLTTLKALSFDCYATLIDWEKGIAAVLARWAREQGLEMGDERSALLHVAQSLFHDHVPAKREQLPSVWINRRHDRPGRGATPEPSGEWSCDLELTSMAAFADAVDKAFAAAGR